MAGCCWHASTISTCHCEGAKKAWTQRCRKIKENVTGPYGGTRQLVVWAGVPIPVTIYDDDCARTNDGG
eukprot:3352741-Rhodomonas_salina.1